MQTIPFVNGRFIEKTYRLSKSLHHPDKAAQNPVLTATEPWESLMCAYGSIIHDEGLFRAYYTMWWLQDEPPYSCLAEGMAYAFSDDGINWTKPHLGLIEEVNGGKNNLIRYGMFADQPCVVRMPEPRNGKKYVMAYYGDFAPLGPGVRLCFSEDGIRWDWPGTLVWKTPIDAVADSLDFYAADDTINFFFDPISGKYVLPRKVMQDADLVYDPARHSNWKPSREALVRMIARCESEDLVHWSNHRVILAPDLEDPPLVDFHRLGVTPYAGGYLGLLEIHNGSPEAETISLDLVASDDGFSWTRPCRGQQPFLANGEADAWDGGVIFAPPRFLIRGAEALIYYGGMQARLNAESMGKCRTYGIGVARIPIDRFCSLRAAATEAGLLITKPLPIRDSIWINAFVRDEGLIQVALCTAEGESISGFGWDDCDPIAGNVTRGQLRWHNQTTPGPGNYRFSARVRDADLYSFYIA